MLKSERSPCDREEREGYPFNDIGKLNRPQNSLYGYWLMPQEKRPKPFRQSAEVVNGAVNSGVSSARDVAHCVFIRTRYSPGFAGI
jgi:hypothetical protein